MKHIDVLIVDDEEKFADMLAKRLTLRGFKCEICDDGKSALQWIRTNPSEAPLILLDLQLPDMYGTKVLSGMKSINPVLPVVIVTGHGTEKDRQECMQLGAVAFRNKPLSLDDITSLILDHK